MNDSESATARREAGRAVTREVDDSPDAWPALKSKLALPLHGSLVLLVSKHPHLPRHLLLNMLARESVHGQVPSLLVQSRGATPDTDDVLYAATYGATLESIHAPRDPEWDWVFEREYKYVLDSAWARCREAADWVRSIEAIPQHRELGVDPKFVFIESLQDLPIFGVPHSRIRESERDRLAALTTMLKAVATLHNVTVVAATTTDWAREVSTFSWGSNSQSETGYLASADVIVALDELKVPARRDLTLPDGAVVVQAAVTTTATGCTAVEELVYRPQFAGFWSADRQPEAAGLSAE